MLSELGGLRAMNQATTTVDSYHTWTLFTVSVCEPTTGLDVFSLPTGSQCSPIKSVGDFVFLYQWI